MIRLSVNEMTTYRWSFEEDVSNYCEAGISAMGVWRRKLADYGEDKGIELLARSGLKASNVLWAGGFTGSDYRTYEESLADAREAVQLAAALGAAHVVVYSGSRNGHTLNHAKRLFASALAELLPEAEKQRVTLAIEPMHCGCADAWTFLTTLDCAVSLVEQLDSPWVKLAFDTYQLGHDPRIVERIGAIARHIGVVHLADGATPPEREQDRRCLGEGTLPLRCIVRALAAAGYQGYYDVELIGEDIERRDYRQLLADAKAAYCRLVDGR
jgi:sugar phosphate isomerase/epimerase